MSTHDSFSSITADTEIENVNKRLTKHTSNLNVTGVSEVEVDSIVMNISRINALKASVSKQNDISKLLLSGRETLDKRSKIESAFRICKEAFMEVTTVLTHMLGCCR